MAGSVAGNRSIPSVNPATGEVIGEVAIASADEVAAAVHASAETGREWARVDFRDRARIVRAWAANVRTNLDRIARLESLDAGIPLRVARDDLQRGADRMTYYADLVWELKGSTFPARDGAFVYSIRQPYGVIAAITPYNHPALFALSKVAAPLLAGNTVVIKPPEQASMSTLALMDLLPSDAPTGIVRVVTGDRSTGQALVRHPLVRKVSFTGSVSTGRAIMRDAGDRIVPVVLELGGKNAVVVLPDAPVQSAVQGVLKGMALGVCGQSCQSGTRLFLHTSMHGQFVEALAAGVKRVRIGDPLAEETEMGPLISSAQHTRVMDFVDGARREGAILVTGGRTPDLPEHLRSGFFVEPTILDGVQPDMVIAQEETFGPVLSVLSWSDEAEMLRQVNALEFGLTASVWTPSLKAHEFARRIEAGYVYINHHGGSSEGAPFGGWKQSGLGTEHSLEELHEFTQVKTVDAWVTSD